MQPSCTNNGTLLKVHDADTIDALIDLGFRISFRTPLRFSGINAPELSAQAGRDARDFLKSIIGTELVPVSKNNPPDKYGRWLAEVYHDEPEPASW